jgi:tetratricopeptide (TPR) repeat protein
MNKENVMSLVLGLLVGLVVGFIFANNYNRSAGQTAAVVSTASNTSTSKQNLPPNHPPLGNTSEEETSSQTGENPIPMVAAAIEKAKSQPQDFEAQMTAADLYYQIQRFDEAALYYENAARLKPNATEPMIKAGNAYFDGEKYEQAANWYEQVLQKEPKNVEVRTDLGLSYFLREPRDIDRAIKEYNASLAIKPDHEVTLQNLALAYSEKGDRAAFQSTVDKLKKVNPANPVVTKTFGTTTN